MAVTSLSSNNSIPAMHSAIIQGTCGQLIISNGIPVPEVVAGTVLIKTLAVALMPADYKMRLAFPTPGVGVGMDFVGRVAKLFNDGRNQLSVGDTVCGAVPGSVPGQPWNGAFATYILAPADLVIRVPAHMPPLLTVSMGTPLLTCSMSLWGSLSSLGLKGTPANPASLVDSKVVLVYGGSSACGTMAIQLLKLSGHQPIATCSPKNFDLVKSFGSSVVFDYSTPEIGGIIRKHTNGKLRYALDCITDKASMHCCYEAMGRPGGSYAGLEHFPDDWKTRSVIKADFVLCIEAFGTECPVENSYYRPKSKEKHEWAVKLHNMYQTCLEMGRIKPHPLEVVGNTFESILDGLDLLKTGAVSGKRLAVVFPEGDSVATN